MSWRQSLVPLVGLVCLLAWAASASATPRTYQIRRLQSSVAVGAAGDIQITFNPLVGSPMSYSLSGFSILTGRPSGSAVADVGLPDQFMGGAHGLLLSSFEATTEFDETTLLLTDIFAPIEALLPTPPPIPLVGAAFVMDIADLVVRLDGPLPSRLISVDDPNVYHWAGGAPVTIEGSLNLSIQIPGQAPIGLPEPVPFSAPLNPGALFGTFTGDAVSTTLDVGLDAATVNPDTAALAQPIPIDLGLLGNITVTPTGLGLLVQPSYTLRNAQGGLPLAPGGAGCGIGPELAALMPALGWLWRRRRAS